MKLSKKNGIKLFEEWEGRESHVYSDVAGYPTIGIGHKLTPSELTSGKIYLNGIACSYHNGLTDN